MAPSRVLLTGANGFLGTHILQQLLSKPDVSVRAVVRSESKMEAVRANTKSDSLGKLDFAIVPDITAPAAFNAALTDNNAPFDAVIHTASPAVYSGITENEEFLDPAVLGTMELLRTVKAFGRSVKRVVMTSSFAAVADLGHMDRMAGKVLTEEDWNPITWEEALQGSLLLGYVGSKKFAEGAAWVYMREEQPAFDLVTICPPMIYGPLAHSISGPEELNQSNLRIYNGFIKSKKDDHLPTDGLYLCADPRDVAAAHIAALYTENREASNQRFIISAGHLSSQYISDTLRENFPELEERTPIGRPGVSSLPHNPYDTTAEKAKRILGVECRPLKETLVDLGRQLIDLEKKGAAR